MRLSSWQRGEGKTKFVSMEDKRLGEILLNKGLIKKEDLDKSLKEQKINGRLLGAILVERRLLSKEKISEILGLKKKIRSVSLPHLKISRSVVKLIPERLARRFLALAVSKKDKRLNIVMADPKDIVAIDTLRSVTGYEIIPSEGKAGEILSAI